MPHPCLIFSQSDYLIQEFDTNIHTEWQTVQIQISWLLQKPTDLDLHYLQRQGISGFSRTRVNSMFMHKFRLINLKSNTMWKGTFKQIYKQWRPWLICADMHLICRAFVCLQNMRADWKTVNLTCKNLTSGRHIVLCIDALKNFVHWRRIKFRN